jgi:hypothetical protein
MEDDEDKVCNACGASFDTEEEVDEHAEEDH